MEAILWILGGITGFVVLFFFLGISIQAKASDLKAKKKLNEIYEASQLRKKDKPKPSDEFKSRDGRKEIVTGQAVSKEYEKFREKEVEFQEGLVKVEKKLTLKDDTVIVDVAKPVGFWSRLIMSQKLGFMMALKQQMNKNHNNGYFVNLMKAQARSQSKEKGRGM